MDAVKHPASYARSVGVVDPGTVEEAGKQGGEGMGSGVGTA